MYDLYIHQYSPNPFRPDKIAHMDRLPVFIIRDSPVMLHSNSKLTSLLNPLCHILYTIYNVNGSSECISEFVSLVFITQVCHFFSRWFVTGLYTLYTI